jgi:SAM-dependent methyltransferase
MDAVDAVLGRRNRLVPPRGLWFLGGGKLHEQIVEDGLRHFTAAGLTPRDHVLDMGCGISFLAVRLTRFLTEGTYDGFDVIEPAIRWASSHITPAFPKFRFQHADVFSKHYNPNGKIKPEEFTFPYGPDTFSFAVGSSLFTHLLPAAAQRYLGEMGRTLKPGGLAWLTIFLINDESAALIRAGRSTLALTPQGDSWVLDPKFPETAIGFAEPDFRQWCETAGLEIKNIDRGSWCGRKEYAGGHDHIVLRKK